jgi:hypothetical protein
MAAPYRRRPQGVRRYVNALVPALRALNVPLDLVLLGGSPRDLPAGWRTSPSRAIRPPISGGRSWGCRCGARRAGIELLHAPAYTAPVGIRTRSWSRSTTSATSGIPSGIPIGVTAAARVLSRERAIGGAGRDRFGVLGRRDPRRLRHPARSHRGGAAGRRAALSPPASRGVGRGGAVRAARGRSAPRRNLPVVLDASSRCGAAAALRAGS